MNRSSDHEIDSLTKFKLSDISSLKFQKQFEKIQKLNLVPSESLVESIISASKIEILIHELILIQIWKLEIYPLLKDNSITSYFIFYHEANLINLLQLVFCNQNACKNTGEALLDLINYLNGKLVTLVNWKHPAPKDAKAIMTISDQQVNWSIYFRDSMIQSMNWSLHYVFHHSDYSDLLQIKSKICLYHASTICWCKMIWLHAWFILYKLLLGSKRKAENLKSSILILGHPSLPKIWQ